MNKLPTSIRTPLIYAVFGILWIFFSDTILEIVSPNREFLTQAQTIKGWLYVIVTTLLLNLLIMRDNARARKQEQEKRDVFDATVKAAHHILHNFLNQMTLFKMEAEESDDFEKEVIIIFDEVMGEAQTQIRNLSMITDVTKEQIEQSVAPKL